MLRLLVVVSFLFFIVSCSTDRPTGKTEAEVLFKEAQDLMKEERYLLATERLNTLRQQYPYSYYATHAELMQADILFAQENFVEAAASYVLFKDFHPKHKKTAYVLWRIAESYYFQLPETFDRDLGPGHEAIKYYEELKRVYGKYEKANSAKEKIVEIRKMIEEKEKYIADFYYKTEVYVAARFRYLDILKNFNNQTLRDHSMIRIVRSSGYLNEQKRCKRHFKIFKTKISKEQRNQLERALKACLN
ncbi:MAG: outer membrane protein assembly factor BamD [Bacteriovoracaceae bacterium]|nr:outer membrane protein assembly factor BamD [Bacteriovoracaceae bacterium]